MILKKSNYLYVLLLSIFVFSCSKEEGQKIENTYLVSADLVKSYSLNEYKQVIQRNLGSQGGGFDISSFVTTGINQYKITYKTKDPLGKEIVASGAFISPITIENEIALGSLQHGTIFNETDAPSYFSESSEATLGSFLASTGMLIALPDYIGYGASKTSKHPYEHNKGLSEPSIDFLRAVKEYISNNKLKWNKKLLIAGYSEGGYASMAMLKKIDSDFSSEFNITAASLGAGAYNKTASVLKTITENSSGNPTHNSSYIWVLRTYNELEGLNRSMKTYFKEPYATQIEQNGEKVSYSLSFRDLLQPDFIKGLVDGTDKPFLDAIKRNDVYDWKPKIPLSLYHGTADTYVPFLNTQTTFDTMKKNGAANVNIIPINGKDHTDAVSDYFLGTFQLFLSYR